MSGRVNGILAVTRNLGDRRNEDKFLILACDGLWDIMGDQGAISLVRHISDAQAAAETFVKHALERRTNDNVTVLTSPRDSLEYGDVNLLFCLRGGQVRGVIFATADVLLLILVIASFRAQAFQLP
ncbi:phosphatase 2C-like domain-containing protein [Suillus lakei]|nr:phosphatase 2C-like domain-containing protein [Suillus lakei]